ncbi:fibrous sheath-interacting protein 1 [Cyrtonyx montezumae]|uniref:fibrous sheath-interacting protein 1 n=1 Tax=Cyrtonyx montezumae TaxID=9017 RepID=UPI0032DB56A2
MAAVKVTTQPTCSGGNCMSCRTQPKFPPPDLVLQDWSLLRFSMFLPSPSLIPIILQISLYQGTKLTYSQKGSLIFDDVYDNSSLRGPKALMFRSRAAALLQRTAPAARSSAGRARRGEPLPEGKATRSPLGAGRHGNGGCGPGNAAAPRPRRERAHQRPRNARRLGLLRGCFWDACDLTGLFVYLFLPVPVDIPRGSLDNMSRPESRSRAYHSYRHLSVSTELLTPELCLPKVDSPVSLGVSQQRSIDNCSPEENKECVSNSDSGDDSTETQTSAVCEPSQGNISNTKEANSSMLLGFEEAEGDPQIRAAIRKMNKLDTVLSKRHVREKAIKKQGKEARAKLWEELKSVSTMGIHEEIENTKLFLTLISWQDRADPSHVKEDKTHALIFHTQTNPEDYAFHKTQHNKDNPSEIETNKFLNQAEKPTQNKSKNSQHFIKKNVELAKDSGKQVPMLEGERQRLIELLKDMEDGSLLQDPEEDVCVWLAPGEGYTPEPMEFHHLNEIDMKLQILLSNGDSSAISSSCSNPPSQIYQESLVHANRSLEVVPGEKVLRDNKEYRDQQNRLKEIDCQLKSLERNFTEEKTGLSEEQLKTLLEECMQPQRTISNVTMPKSQESLSCGLCPPCYKSQDSILHSPSTLSKMLVEDHIVGMLTALEKAGLEDKSSCVNAESKIPSYYISKALADSHLSKDSLAQTEEPDDLEGLQKMRDKGITEGYFMSRALNTERLKKPSFLGEPLYCISMNNEPSTGPDILSIPLQTKGGETLNNPLE